VKRMRSDHASIGGNAYDGSIGHTTRDTLSLGQGARALSSIFYGVGPGIGLTAAIRPHLHGVRLGPVQGRT